MTSWFACLSCECDHSGKVKNIVQESAEASEPPVLVSTDESILLVSDGKNDQSSSTLDSESDLEYADSHSTDNSVSNCGSASDLAEQVRSRGDPKSANKKHRSANKKHTETFIVQGLGKFRKKMLTATGPGEVEHDRGVFIEEVYDFYDPSTARVRARKMTENVVHRRRGSISSIPSCDLPKSFQKSSMSTNSGDLPMSRQKSSMSTNSDEESFHSGSSGKSGDKSSKRMCGKVSYGATPVLRRKQSKSNLELVAGWGALVGKVLNRLVVDFPAITSMLLREKRYLAAAKLSRGSSQTKNSVQEKAGFVVSQAMKLAKRLKRDQRELLDGEWEDGQLLSFLFSTSYIDILLLFSRAVAKLLHQQPTVAVALAPCRVFGDIHGQLRDLLLLFACFGMPSENNTTTFVFNGDFVDRGAHQVEVIGLLLALKLCMPERVWLVRGNHEDREMNKRYGFKHACLSTLGSEFGPIVFERIHQAFDELPLACLIEKKIMCVHGGIGDGTWTLDKLQTVKRPLKEVSTISWLGDILWSDPIEDGMSADPEVFGVHESPRGKSGSLFAWNVTKTFCARNGLSLIIRSHQSKNSSPGFDVMHEHLLIRVFSARDYEDHGNDGAILKIEKQSEAGKELLKIRAQVLRSVTKTRQEAHRRQGQQSKEKSQVSKTPSCAYGTGKDAKTDRRRSRESRRSSKEVTMARRSSTKVLVEALPD